ncbi:hypothetical protein [Flavobacterium sp. H122]|uniref:hypothetical protein n=1 Tax=Flavobacterium sp. H122 TaxID=2529860 RepID=UPI0010AA538D|nr:hypothetical protein [Flavobacterium sp. H122]
MQHLFFGILFLVLLVSCHDNKIDRVERAFYYWKSGEYSLSDDENKCLDTLNVKKLYVKFFEVTHDETMGNIPISKNRLDIYNYEGKNEEVNSNVVPAVFIKNEVFIKSSKSEIDTLISNVEFLVKKYKREHFSTKNNEIKEIQFDCDWTLKSKENYFYFLREFHKKSKIDLSCTLRLYPYKYRSKMGVPPVKKVTLMCYNLMQPFESKSKNSILDIEELKSYLTVVEKYPLHMDIALPIFSWCYHYQYDQFQRFTNLNAGDLKKIATRKSSLWYEVTKDSVINEVYYRQGDKLKFEEVNQNTVQDVIKILKSKVQLDKKSTVILFHLDSNNLKSYNYETLGKFYTSFSI